MPTMHIMLMLPAPQHDPACTLCIFQAGRNGGEYSLLCVGDCMDNWSPCTMHMGLGVLGSV